MDIENSDTLCVLESAIDLMSYLTLIKLHGIDNFKHHLLSMCGTSYITIEKYLEKNPQIKKIILCLEANDEGQFFAQKIKEKFGETYEFKSHIPKGKDFNEDLVSFFNPNDHLTRIYEPTSEVYYEVKVADK